MNFTYKTLSFLIVTLIVTVSAWARDMQPDNCEFIRTALLDPNVREIIIPAGSYTANRPIVVDRSGVSLVGKGQVTITLADHANSPLLILGNIQTPPKTVYDLKVSNLILKGNKEDQDMECWGGPCDSNEKAVIRNNGITIRGVVRAIITDVQTLSMRSGGIVTEKVSSHLNIKNWVSKDNFFDGFAGYETTESTFENLELSENLGAGISLDIRFHGNVFKNVLMSQNKDVGIFMRDSNDNRFINHKIMDSGNHGVFISQVDDQSGTLPLNNTFENLIVAGAKGNGVHLNQANSNTKLIDAKFSGITGKDVFEPELPHAKKAYIDDPLAMQSRQVTIAISKAADIKANAEHISFKEALASIMSETQHYTFQHLVSRFCPNALETLVNR